MFTARYGLGIYIVILRSAHTAVSVFCVDLRTNSDFFPYTALTDWFL